MNRVAALLVLCALGLPPGMAWAQVNGTGSLALTVSNTEALRIVSSGFVGIGTSAPAAALDVSGSVNATTVKLTDNPATVCSPETAGTIKVVNGRPYICRSTP